jgi:hypothetical protein
MSRGMRIVAPFRPFVAEAPHHQELAAAETPFDWIAAIRMMSHSAAVACQCPVHVITDVDTDLPVPCLKYQTTARRLMLWNFEVCLAYLRSADFDRDTVMLDSDQLVYQNLAKWFRKGVDLGILIREPPKQDPLSYPILNGVQWWALAGRDRLIAFYEQALAIAAALPEDQIVWGADTTALWRLLEPIEPGRHHRAGLTVALIDSRPVLQALSGLQMRWVTQGCLPRPTHAVLDFRNTRKPYMQAVYDATIASAVPA